MHKKILNDGLSNLHFKHLFLSSAGIFQIIFFQLFFFRNTIRVSNSLDPGKVRPDIIGLVWTKTFGKSYQQTANIRQTVTVGVFLIKMNWYKWMALFKHTCSMVQCDQRLFSSLSFT